MKVCHSLAVVVALSLGFAAQQGWAQQPQAAPAAGAAQAAPAAGAVQAVPAPAITITQDSGRSTFLRMEENAWAGFRVTNGSGRAVQKVTARISFNGSERQESLGDLDAGGSAALKIPVDTRLRPDAYPIKVAVSAQGEAPLSAQAEATITIVARPIPNRMPVFLWGLGDIPTMKDIGFTHCFVYDMVDYKKVFAEQVPVPAREGAALQQARQKLDNYLANGLLAIAHYYPATRGLAEIKDEHGTALSTLWKRVNRQGTAQNKAGICASIPELQWFAEKVGIAVAMAYGDHPALDGALLSSEVRDSTELCFHDWDKAAYREYSGQEIPEQAKAKFGLRYDSLPGFPANRIIKDDDPILTYYRWFWKNGDGFNGMHAALNRGLHTNAHPGFFTFFDPAIRAPSIWGSGARLDAINTWTYVYPDPIKMGQTTDELFAMASGSPGQKVLSMTTMIWYRSATAPKPSDDPAKVAQWEKDTPKAKYITIPPDALREAFWCKIARPVGGIGYFAWTALVPSPGVETSYSFTNAETRPVLTKVIHDVVQPLGSTLMQVGDRPADVALLESFTSQIFAGRGSFGSGDKWDSDAHLILQYAELQPRIIYEENILRDGLDGYKVLVMPNCDVLPESVYERIKAWQLRGGILVADQNLAPALLPDILLPAYRRVKNDAKDKAALQKAAADLRAQLDDIYERHGDSSTPDVIVRFRQAGSADYLFAINDKRTYGTYVGQHGLVMEQGVETTSTLSASRPGASVYDLLAHKLVPARSAGEGIAWDANIGPGDGKIYLIVDRPIASLKVEAPARAARGATAALKIAALDSSSKTVDAVVPMQVEILDPQSRPAEGSGYYGAKDGALTIPLALAQNDLPGAWKVRVNDLASGLTKDVTIDVTP